MQAETQYVHTVGSFEPSELVFSLASTWPCSTRIWHASLCKSGDPGVKARDFSPGMKNQMVPNDLKPSEGRLYVHSHYGCCVKGRSKASVFSECSWHVQVCNFPERRSLIVFSSSTRLLFCRNCLLFICP